MFLFLNAILEIYFSALSTVNLLPLWNLCFQVYSPLSMLSSETTDSLSAVNGAFAVSQHPAKQNPKGGKVCLPVSCMCPLYPGITSKRRAQWALEKSSAPLSNHKQAFDSQGYF